jgi:hypothetical protein
MKPPAAVQPTTEAIRRPIPSTSGGSRAGAVCPHTRRWPNGRTDGRVVEVRDEEQEYLKDGRGHVDDRSHKGIHAPREELLRSLRIHPAQSSMPSWQGGACMTTKHDAAVNRVKANEATFM